MVLTNPVMVSTSETENEMYQSHNLDAGNDMTTANDIYKGLHYGFDLKNISVVVMEYDNSATILSASKIPKTSHYHLLQFFDAGIQMWWYFYVGESETIPFVWTS